MSADRLRIGFIPLCDAAALIVAADKGFCAQEGLDVELVREVSWSNVRDKLNIGHFDAAHLLAPVAIASSLGLGHFKIPIIAPFNLGINGNAITISPSLHRALAAEAGGGIDDPLKTAQALARVVKRRREKGEQPLTFGMTFPYSTHNYHLRFWMAAGGVDPDEDVRLVVLPPPYMVDSLASGHVDGFCVGAPWNSVAVDRGIGYILHLVSDILASAAEKVLAMRRSWADDNPETVARLVRAHHRAAEFIEGTVNRDEVSAILAAPNRRAPEGGARRHRPHQRSLSSGRASRRCPSEHNPRGLALRPDGALETGASFGRTPGRSQGGVPAGHLRPDCRRPQRSG